MKSGIEIIRWQLLNVNEDGVTERGNAGYAELKKHLERKRVSTKNTLFMNLKKKVLRLRASTCHHLIMMLDCRVYSAVCLRCQIGRVYPLKAAINSNNVLNVNIVLSEIKKLKNDKDKLTILNLRAKVGMSGSEW